MIIWNTFTRPFWIFYLINVSIAEQKLWACWHMKHDGSVVFSVFRIYVSDFCSRVTMEQNKKRVIPVSNKMLEYPILRFAFLICLWKQSHFHTRHFRPMAWLQKRPKCIYVLISIMAPSFVASPQLTTMVFPQWVSIPNEAFAVLSIIC